MGVINKTTDTINVLLDKTEDWKEKGIPWTEVINKPHWVTSATKPTYTAAEVGALPSTTHIPTKVSELENDSNFTKATSFKTINGYSIVGVGNIEITGIGGGGVADSVEWNKVLNKPLWVNSETKPTYKPSEVGAIPTGGLKTINGETLEGEGDIVLSTSGMYIFDANELLLLADAGESDLSLTLKDSIVTAYENKAAFAEIEGASYLLVISPNSTGYDIFVQNIVPVGDHGLYYIGLTASVNTTTNKILVVSSLMSLPSITQVPTEAPADGRTYGRKNKQWVEIVLGGGGSVQIVDISDLYEKYIKGGFGEAEGTITQEDYNTLESYATSKDIICVCKRPIAGYVVQTINIYYSDNALYLFTEDFGYGLVPAPCVYLFDKVNLTYTATRLVYVTSESINARGLFLGKYQKPTSYTPIATSDSVLEALGKLEAGVSQGSSGGAQAVDITDLIARLIQVALKNSYVSDEDYSFIEKYCAESSLLYSQQDGNITARYSLKKTGTSYDLVQIAPDSLVENLSIEVLKIS